MIILYVMTINVYCITYDKGFLYLVATIYTIYYIYYLVVIIYDDIACNSFNLKVRLRAYRQTNYSLCTRASHMVE